MTEPKAGWLARLWDFLHPVQCRNCAATPRTALPNDCIGPTFAVMSSPLKPDPHTWNRPLPAHHRQARASGAYSEGRRMTRQMAREIAATRLTKQYPLDYQRHYDEALAEMEGRNR